MSITFDEYSEIARQSDFYPKMDRPHPDGDVVGFDSRGAGPFANPLTVAASMIEHQGYRIAIYIGALAAGMPTVEQSRALRGLLEQAERDVIAGVVAEDPPEVSCG